MKIKHLIGRQNYKNCKHIDRKWQTRLKKKKTDKDLKIENYM